MRVDRQGRRGASRSTTRTPRPDVAVTSLHYYFPWAITALVRWCAFCLADGGACASTSTRAVVRRSATARTRRTKRSSRVPPARRRALPGRRYARVLRPARSPHLEEAAHEWFERRRVRPAARRHGALDVPARTSTSSSSRTTAGCWPPGPARRSRSRMRWKNPWPGPPPPPGNAGRLPLTRSVIRCVSSEGTLLPKCCFASATSAAIRPAADLPVVAIRDLRERLAGAELREEARLRDAEVGRGGVEPCAGPC